MAPPTKPSGTPTMRRKSPLSKVITIKLSSDKLRQFGGLPSKEESPSKDSSSTTSNPPLIVASSASDNPPDSASNTPAANGTPTPSAMPPPTEAVKKRGVKRTSAVALGPDGVPIPKVRGKPGPKKRPRLEDGTIDHSNTTPRAAPGTAAHKLGPKANQGAINAGLRALDRSGKPCRKWEKGHFKLKSFTGVEWEVKRWTTTPRVTVEVNLAGSASGDSTKENKENSQIASEKSNGIADIEKASAVSQNPGNSSPVLPTVTLPAPVDGPTLALPPTIEIKDEVVVHPPIDVKEEVPADSIVTASA